MSLDSDMMAYSFAGRLDAMLETPPEDGWDYSVLRSYKDMISSYKLETERHNARGLMTGMAMEAAESGIPFSSVIQTTYLMGRYMQSINEITKYLEIHARPGMEQDEASAVAHFFRGQAVESYAFARQVVTSALEGAPNGAYLGHIEDFLGIERGVLQRHAGAYESAMCL